MSAPSATAIASAPRSARTWIVFALVALGAWLGMIKLPRPASIEIFDAQAMALDYSVRHDTGLGSTLPSFTGPLGALLTDVLSGQPIGPNYRAHVFTYLAFALGLAWITIRQTGSARWWLLGVFGAIGCYRPDYAQLFLLLIAGFWLKARPLGAVEASGVGAILGLLGLIDSRYAWLAVLAILGSRSNLDDAAARRGPKFAAGAMLGVLLIGWIGLGQPILELPAWLWHGLVDSPVRYSAAAPLWASTSSWAVVTTWLLLAILPLAVLAGSAPHVRRFAPAAFALGVVLLAWRRATGTPEALPQLFFATVVMAAIAWLAIRPSGGETKADFGFGLLALVAGGALVLAEPRILTQSILVLNQNMDAAGRGLLDREGWEKEQARLYKNMSEEFSLPQIKGTIGTKRVDFLGNPVGYALVNGLNYTPRPGLQSFRVESAALARRDADFYSRDGAPEFVVQRLQAYDRALPPLEDSLAQLALYANYDFQLEERGFLLWQRSAKPVGPVTLGEPAWHTEATWGQPVALPARPGRAIWIEIKVRRSISGWLAHQLRTASDPTLALRDDENSVLSYRASPTALATGFLLNPLFRGEIDLVRYQAGETLPLIRELTLNLPAGHDGDFAKQFEIFVYEVPAVPVSGRKESAANLAQRFRIANRLPVAVAAYYPPAITAPDGKEVLFMHPESSLEFSVKPGDTHLTGGFGVIAAAYTGDHSTDGVEFVVEYFPATGQPAVLWRRHLDPGANATDRGLLTFSVALPQPAAGRIVLRTQNLPGHTAAWDWSFWTDLRFDSN
ncbi:MAG TPA: hypothetical protein VFJ90_10305 [Candidatus Didemnitutus sp.]|nr:hypothetical protein [Candidatus Didemnitutus sp.]